MRQLLVSTVVLGTLIGAQAASAQPVAPPETCGVTFVRASDEARAAIENYLRAEPRCTSSIELRVVATEGGYYLVAQRPDGRIHERIVPDLSSAGVLVASWIADDWTSAPAPASPPPSAPVAYAPAPAIAPPGATAVTKSALPRDTKWHRWLTLGPKIVTGSHEGRGLRLESDLLAVGKWRIGASVSYGSYNIAYVGYDIPPTSTDVDLGVNLGRAVHFGRWELRWAFGAGARYARERSGTIDPMWGLTITDEDRVSLQAETSFLVTRRIGESWGVGVGPLATLVQTFGGTALRFEAFGGVRYEL